MKSFSFTWIALTSFFVVGAWPTDAGSSHVHVASSCTLGQTVKSTKLSSLVGSEGGGHERSDDVSLPLSFSFHLEPSFTNLSHCGRPDGDYCWATLCRFTLVGIYGSQGEPNCALQLLWKWNSRRFFIGIKSIYLWISIWVWDVPNTWAQYEFQIREYECRKNTVRVKLNW